MLDPSNLVSVSAFLNSELSIRHTLFHSLMQQPEDKKRKAPTDETEVQDSHKKQKQGKKNHFNTMIKESE